MTSLRKCHQTVSTFDGREKNQYAMHLIFRYLKMGLQIDKPPRTKKKCCPFCTPYIVIHPPLFLGIIPKTQPLNTLACHLSSADAVPRFENLRVVGVRHPVRGAHNEHANFRCWNRPKKV